MLFSDSAYAFDFAIILTCQITIHADEALPLSVALKLTVDEWCREAGISQASFYHWQKTIA